MENCPICGLILDDTSWGRKFCKNHGIIEEEESTDDDHSYIG